VTTKLHNKSQQQKYQLADTTNDNHLLLTTIAKVGYSGHGLTDDKRKTKRKRTEKNKSFLAHNMFANPKRMCQNLTN
jgi:hypothetical protein